MPLDSTTAVKIRPGTLFDVPETIELGREMASKGWFRDMVYDTDRAYQTGVPYVSDPKHFYRVAEVEGEIVGFIMCHLTPYFFADDFFAEEFLWYVTPKHRNGSIAFRLWESFEDWAKAKDAKEIYIAPVIEGDTAEQIAKWLERKGYTRTPGGLRRKLR